MYLTAGTLPGNRKEIAGVVRQLFEGRLRPTWLGGVPRKFGSVHRFISAAVAKVSTSSVSVTLGKKDMEAVRDLKTKGEFAISSFTPVPMSLCTGAFKPIVDSVHSFDRDGVLSAFEKIMSKHARGKVVVKITDEE